MLQQPIKRHVTSSGYYLLKIQMILTPEWRTRRGVVTLQRVLHCNCLFQVLGSWSKGNKLPCHTGGDVFSHWGTRLPRVNTGKKITWAVIITSHPGCRHHCNTCEPIPWPAILSLCSTERHPWKSLFEPQACTSSKGKEAVKMNVCAEWLGLSGFSLSQKEHLLKVKIKGVWKHVDWPEHIRLQR